MMIIYLLTNTVNDKVYVGQTIQTLTERWRKHRSHAKRGKQSRIAKAIRKYGDDVFERQILASAANKSELDNLEKLWICLLQSTNGECGYNVTAGGERRSITVDGIEKMRASLTGRKRTFEECQSLSRSQFKKWADPEYKKRVGQAISAGLTGRKLSPEHRQNMINGHLGKCPKWSDPIARANKIKASWDIRRAKNKEKKNE